MTSPATRPEDTQMTASTTAGRSPARPWGLLTGLVRASLTVTADRVHAAGDARARARGWAITPTAGPFGLAGRSYRDPRFGPPQPGSSGCGSAANLRQRPTATARERSGA